MSYFTLKFSHIFCDSSFKYDLNLEDLSLDESYGPWAGTSFSFGTAGKESSDSILRCRKCVINPENFGRKRIIQKEKSSHPKSSHRSSKTKVDKIVKSSSRKEIENLPSKNKEIIMSPAPASSPVQQKPKIRTLFPVKRVKSRPSLFDDEEPASNSFKGSNSTENLNHSIDADEFKKEYYRARKKLRGLRDSTETKKSDIEPLEEPINPTENLDRIPNVQDIEENRPISPQERLLVTPPPSGRKSDVHEVLSSQNRFNNRYEVLNSMKYLLSHKSNLGVLGDVLESIFNEISTDSRDFVVRNLEYHQFFKGCRLLICNLNVVAPNIKGTLLNAVDKLIITFDGWSDDPLKLNIDSIAKTPCPPESIPQFVNLLCNYKGINMDRTNFQMLVKNVNTRQSSTEPSDPRILVKPLPSLIASPSSGHDFLQSEDIDNFPSPVEVAGSISQRTVIEYDHQSPRGKSNREKCVCPEQMKKLAENIAILNEDAQKNISRLLHNNNMEHLLAPEFRNL